MSEVATYPSGPVNVPQSVDVSAIVVPLRLRLGGGVLSLFSTTMVFGSPLDVTLSELAVESFFPVDGATADLVGSLSA
jgi:hypothetical protein